MSPDGLPMDFDNRYKMEAFKGGNNRPPNAIAPIGVHGALQNKVNNASAKLHANFDFRKYKQQSSLAAARNNDLGMRHTSSNQRLSKMIP